MSLFVFVFEKNICFYPNSPSSPRKGRRGQGKPKDQKIQGEHFYIWIKTNQKLQCAFLLLIVGQNRQPSDSKSLWSRFREPAGEPSTNIDKVLTLQVFTIQLSQLNAAHATWQTNATCCWHCRSLPMSLGVPVNSVMFTGGTGFQKVWPRQRWIFILGWIQPGP